MHLSLTVFVASPDIRGEQALGVLRLAGPLEHAGIHQIWWDETVNVSQQIIQADLVVIQRNFAQRRQPYAQIIAAARQADKPIVFEIDDLLWELPAEHPDRQKNVYAEAQLPMLMAATQADAITVASPALGEYFRAFFHNIYLLPNYLNESLWAMRPPRPLSNLPPAKQTTTIGFMGGNSHVPDLELITPVLKGLCQRYGSKLILKFWGLQPPAELQSLPNTWCMQDQIARYGEFAGYLSKQECDIWIAPLRQSLFNKCKSAIKFLEYTASGTPGVYSRMPPYEGVVVHGETGLLAGSLDEWDLCLTQLIEQPQTRQQIATKAQEMVRQKWLLADHATEWEQAYRQIIVLRKNTTEKTTDAIAPVFDIVKKPPADSIARPIPNALAGRLVDQTGLLQVGDVGYPIGVEQPVKMHPSGNSSTGLVPHPLVSIILVTYNNVDLTHQCLDSIYNKTDEPTFEVIVVDNASQDDTPYFLMEYTSTHPNMKVILNPINEGFARGNNIGAAVALGEYLVFLNNDTVVTRGWLAGLLRHLKDPTVGMVGPVTNYSSNESRIPVDYDPSSPDLVGLDAFAEKYTHQHTGQAFEVEMLLLLCVAIRRTVYDEVGGIDERYGIGMFEDEDFAQEIRNKSYKLLCAEDVFIHHWGSATFSKLGLAEYWLTHEENRNKFEEKWGRKWYPQLYRPELQREHVRQMVDGSLWLAKQLIESGKSIERIETGARENERKANAAWQQAMEYNEKLVEIQSSRAWKMLVLLRRIRHILIPHLSYRERLASEVFLFIRSPFSWLGMAVRRTLGLIWRARITRWILRLITPRPWKDFYHALGEEFAYTDRTQVVLFAGPEILPDYTPRQALDYLPVQDRPPVKVSLISTAWNEADHARSWLESLIQQSRLPDEIVITDGGSTDGTVAIMREFAESSSIPLFVIEAPGANPSRGRNISIEHATYSIIACTDLGCVLDKDWLKNLIAPFEHDPVIAVSAGSYQAIENTEFDKICARMFVADISQIDPQTFFPSGRSLAMKKSVWARAGGYPEWLTLSGEDTLFDFQIKMQSCKWAFVPQAVVAWRPPSPASFVVKKVFRYARGDGEAAILVKNYLYKIKDWLWTHFQRCFILLAVLLSILFLGNRGGVPSWLLAVIVGILIYASYRFYRTIRYIRKMYHLTTRQALKFNSLSEMVNTSQIIGFIAGVANRKQVRQRQVEQYQRQLERILAQYPDHQSIIVYPPTHDWGFMFQRPQQIARAFVKKGYLYFYCTKNEKTDACFGFWEVEPGLFLTHVPMEVFSSLQRPIVYIGSAWNRADLQYFSRPQVIYDHYDDLGVSSGRIEDHEALLQGAEVVVVTSKGLLDAVKPQRPDVVFAPNGVDYDWILLNRPKSDADIPLDLKPILQTGHPIIGYSGGMAEWFDYDLLAYLAARRTDLEFVLIGVNYDGSLDRSGVLQYRNVHWLGMKSYDELFRYVWQFDVATIPFKVNEITLATSPIKQFEYMACQKPVVTTALPECKRYPDVLVAETYDQFGKQLDIALKLRTDPDFLARITQIARDNIWDKRVNDILTTLDKLSFQSINAKLE